MKVVKIGRTSFNVEAIKAMSLTDFKRTHKHLANAEDLYYQVTGKDKPKPKTKD